MAQNDTATLRVINNGTRAKSKKIAWGSSLHYPSEPAAAGSDEFALVQCYLAVGAGSSGPVYFSTHRPHCLSVM